MSLNIFKIHFFNNIFTQMDLHDLLVFLLLDIRLFPTIFLAHFFVCFIHSFTHSNRRPLYKNT